MSLISPTSVLCFQRILFMCLRDTYALILYIFNSIINDNIFKISISDCLLLLYIDLCILILYPLVLLNSLFSSNRFFYRFHRIFYMMMSSPPKREMRSYSSFQSLCLSVIYLLVSFFLSFFLPDCTSQNLQYKVKLKE